MNDFFNPSGAPSTRSPGASLNIRNEFALIQAGFDKLPSLGGNALELVRVNAAGTALESFADSFLEAADLAPYLTIASAAATYLTQANAAATYATIASLGSYLTTAAAAATYLPLAGGTLTGALLAAVGAVGTPGVAFAGRASDGMWSPAASALAWSTNGTEGMRLTSSQQLSVGGAFTALGKLHVREAASGGAAPNASRDTLVLESGGAAGITLMSPNTDQSGIAFGDDASSVVGQIRYAHATDEMDFVTGGTARLALGGTYARFFGAGANGLLTVLDGTASGATANSNADGIVIDSNGNTGLTILAGSGGASTGQFLFGDNTGNAKGGMAWVGSSTELRVFSTVGDFMVRHSDVATSFPIGFRNLPTIGNTATATAVAVGKCYLNTGNITFNTGVFGGGDIVSVYNNSASAITLTQGAGVTLRLGGTTTTGSRTLAPRGMAVLFWYLSTEAHVSGTGLT